MIIQSIAWALVLTLCNLELERAHHTSSAMLANWQANTGMNWARWFAARRPIIGLVRRAWRFHPLTLSGGNS